MSRETDSELREKIVDTLQDFEVEADNRLVDAFMAVIAAHGQTLKSKLLAATNTFVILDAVDRKHKVAAVPVQEIERIFDE